MNSFKRKASRKFTKYSNILFCDYGIEAVQYATKNLMLCNAGLQLCVSIEDIFSVCSQYGKIEKVNMLPGKSYSFISFEEVHCAEQFYTNANGKNVLKSLKGPLYLLFTEEVPEICENIFETFNQLPPGAIIIENFINETEEAELMFKFGKLDYIEGNCLKHRQVKHYGFEFMYNNNNVDRKNTLEDLPAEVDFLNNRLVEMGFSEVMRWPPDQLTVNVYIPGQGIPPHIDTHSAFEDPILSLSLNANVVMDFQKIGSKDLYSVLLPRRSLLIMSKESRYCWSHGITPRKNDVIFDPKIGGLTVMQRGLRCSLTFRKVRWKKCECQYSKRCDSQKT